ncbi:Gamma-thionin domain-containing protein [Cephalotus follicularis]|uniref:Gamma-thionin domain-containing protein n=1 Tax=Cephalotus follicularis TaxID=3775 RepID=A0A1Q3D7V6_CEPFO
MERKFLGCFWLLLVLLASHEELVPTEARVCESQSHKFHGTCASDHNCGLVCKDEGFSGGKCRGFRRRCFCTKTC